MVQQYFKILFSTAAAPLQFCKPCLKGQKQDQSIVSFLQCSSWILLFNKVPFSALQGTLWQWNALDPWSKSALMIRLNFKLWALSFEELLWLKQLIQQLCCHSLPPPDPSIISVLIRTTCFLRMFWERNIKKQISILRSLSALLKLKDVTRSLLFVHVCFIRTCLSTPLAPFQITNSQLNARSHNFHLIVDIVNVTVVSLES